MRHLPSLDLIFELTRDHYEVIGKWADSLDNKAISIFSVGALLIGVITAIETPTLMCTWQAVLFILAVVSFITTSIFAWKAFRVRGYIATLDPDVLFKEYATRNVSCAKYYLVEYAAKNYKYNKAILEKKAKHVHISMIFVGIEIIALVIWVVSL